MASATQPADLGDVIRRAAPLRVMFAIPELDRGGPDRVMFELLSNLDRKRFAPSLMVSSTNGHYLSRLPADVPIHSLAGSGGASDRYPVLRALRKIRRESPDVVFATLRMNLTLGMVEPFLPRRTRLVLRQANDLSADWDLLVKKSIVKHRLARQLVIATLRRADAVVCQSEAMRTDLRTLLGAKANLLVVANPVDVDAVSVASATPATVRGRPALVGVGRLAPQKGFDILLSAVARLRAGYPEVHLTILGDGPDREALVAQARSLRIESNVTFAGFSREPLPIVRAADLFVLASRYEGFPNAALEALACGTPAVLTDCPGANSEIIKPGVNGRLAAGITSDAVADALALALRELADYDRTVIQSDCRARYSADQIVREYEDIIMTIGRGE